MAQLKQLVTRPDVVEVHDATAADPKMLVFLKSYRNTGLFYGQVRVAIISRLVPTTSHHVAPRVAQCVPDLPTPSPSQVGALGTHFEGVLGGVTKF